MRNLAEIVTVNKEWALAGKDKVHGVSFTELGYEAMVSVDIHVGDLVVFIQEGSLLPLTDTWKMLERLKCYDESEKAYLIKVKKFKDIKSWGLCLKLNEVGLTEEQISKLKAGDDVTELLGIRKKEDEADKPKSCSDGTVKLPSLFKFFMKHKATRWIGRMWLDAHKVKSYDFPSYLISKSDETTIQNMPHILEDYANEEVYITLKMEGMSGTFLCTKKNNGKPDKFMCCSRNKMYSSNVDNEYSHIAKKYDIESKIRKYYKETGRLVAIQGEICGKGVQNNIYHFSDLEFFVYSVKDIITGNQFTFSEMLALCHSFDLLSVPIYTSYVRLHDYMPTIDKAVSLAEKLYFKVYGEDDVTYHYTPFDTEKLWKDYAQHEGIVVRSMNYDKDNGKGISFKVKNIDYQEKGISFIGNMKWLLEDRNESKPNRILQGN